MSSGWKGRIEGLLRDEMRHCFKVEVRDEGYQSYLIEEEFSGPADGSASGFLDHVLSLVQDMRKEMFMKGYSSGVLDAVFDLKEMEAGVEATVSPEITQITAERRFMEADK